MRLVLALILALLLGSNDSRAQGLPFPGPGSTIGLTYTGPGDVFGTANAKAWYSCARAFNGAFAVTTGAICDIVDTATGAASCTMHIKSNGFADLTSLSCAGGTVNVTTFCTVTHAAGCSVTKMYNQVAPGTCDVVQATLASMPLLLLSSTPTGTLPAVQASGSVGTMQTATCTSINPPIVMSGVIDRTSGTTIIPMIGASGGAGLGFNTTGVAMVTGGTPLNGTAANSAWHAVNGLVNGASGAINVDGAETLGNTSTGGVGANALRVARVASLSGTVILAEVGMWGDTQTAAQRNSLCHNQASATYGYNSSFGAC